MNDIVALQKNAPFFRKMEFLPPLMHIKNERMESKGEISLSCVH